MVSVIKRFWLGLLIWCGVMWGQQTNTVYSTLFTNTAAPIIAPVSGSLTNIGQSNHQVVLTFSNAPSKTCTTQAANGQLEFSYDNTNWLEFGTPSNAISNPNTSIWFGTGAFPFVRFNLTSFDTTNCRVSGYYSGILGGALSTQIIGQQPVGQQVKGTSRPILLGGLSGADSSTRGVVTSSPLCNNTAFYTGLTDSTAHMVTPVTSAGISTKLCSVVVSSEAQIIFHLGQGTDNTCNTYSAQVYELWASPFTINTISAGGISPAFASSAITPVVGANYGSWCVQAFDTGGTGTKFYTAIVTYAVLDDVKGLP